MHLVNIRQYDSMLGSTGEFVVCGEDAFMRVGLTTLWMEEIKAWTPYESVHDIESPYVHWYYNPDAKNFEDTAPSRLCPNIHEPTEERAIVEYVKFYDYFDEGILIEGLKDYIWLHPNLSELYRIAEKYNLPKEELDYWLYEARNDREV